MVSPWHSYSPSRGHESTRRRWVQQAAGWIDSIAPGFEKVVRVRFLYPDLVEDKLKSGLTFELRESSRVERARVISTV